MLGVGALGVYGFGRAPGSIGFKGIRASGAGFGVLSGFSILYVG